VLLAVAANSVPTPPNFSDTYTVKGTLYIPYAEIREPFYAWYDLKLGSSRIDYYGGKLNYKSTGIYNHQYIFFFPWFFSPFPGLGLRH
jgi:hypothetical protein